MEIKISSLPTTDNHSYGHTKQGITYLVKDAKEFKEIVALECKKFIDDNELFNEWLEVDITYYLNRDRDVLGSDKILMDAMQGIIFKDDKQILDAHLHKYKDKSNTRVEVVISKANREY